MTDQPPSDLGPTGITAQQLASLEEAETQASGRASSLWGDAWQLLRRNPMFLVPAFFISILFLMAIFPQLFTSTDPRVCDLTRNLGGIPRPSSEFPFGIDNQGCDYYTRVIYGARVSVFIGIITIGFAALIATFLGSVAAYYGGVIDSIISRITDVWFAIPFFLGAIVILSTMGDRTVPIINYEMQRQGFAQVVFVLVILGWPGMLRLMRASVLQVREADYVDAARTLGASDWRIITRHILPNAMAPLIVVATISVGVVISAEAALSFLGIGLRQPSISWGVQLSVPPGLIRQNPHLVIFPGMFLSIAVFSFILIGDALRDALDPKLR